MDAKFVNATFKVWQMPDLQDERLKEILLEVGFIEEMGTIGGNKEMH